MVPAKEERLMVEYTMQQFLSVTQAIMEFCQTSGLQDSEVMAMRVRLDSPGKDGEVQFHLGLPRFPYAAS